MEVCYQTIHSLEGIPGIDEYLCPLGLFFKCTIIVDLGLLRAAGSCANTNHSAAITLGFIKNPCCFAADHTQFCVHMMIKNNLGRYGTVSTQANMQGDKSCVHTLCTRLFKQLLSPMQTGGRCGSRSNFTRIYRLIAFLVLKFRFDIGR